MTRRTAWGMSIVFGAAVFAAGGCDTPREIKEARPIGNGETNSTSSLTPDKAPERSDPSAVAVVGSAIAAHSGQKPELLKSLRSATFTRVGYISGGGTLRFNQTWTVNAVWPDRFRVDAEVENQGKQTIAWGQSGGWQHSAAGGKLPLPPQGVRDYKIDITGDWIGLVFPLAEPGAIVAPAPDQNFNGKPANGVRLWHPELAPAVVHFNKDTNLLAGITYEGRENGVRVTKEITVLSLRAYGGVTLPERIVVRSNNNVLAEWTMTGLEPKPTLDPKVFDEP